MRSCNEYHLPVRVQHRGEARVQVVVLEDVDQGGEDEDPHKQEEEQSPQLAVAGSH